jgi:hypothetical protein
MKLNLTLVFVAALATAATCQSGNISKVEFTTATRGYQKEVFISRDSVIEIVDGRREENTIRKRALVESDWKLLEDALKNLKLESIPTLQSPTSRRTFDAARYSRIRITTRDAKQYEHAFDDEAPHADLKPLMDAILRIQSQDLSR